MAESQEIFSYSTEALANLERNISAARLAPYLVHAGNDRVMAMKRYLWNARLAKSFLYPLQMTEITIRNSMHGAFRQQYRTASWIFSPTFQMTTESEASRKAAHGRLVRRKPHPSADDLVASLSFDFWSNLFRDDYEQLWLTPGLLKAAFPLLPDHIDRPRIKYLVAKINRLRNRIAHHEPIHSMNLPEYLKDIQELLSYLCLTTAAWVDTNSTVMRAWHTPPVQASEFAGTPLTLAKYRAPQQILETDTLAKAMVAVDAGRPRAALVSNPGLTPPYEVLTPSIISAFIMQEATKPESGDMIDLNAHTVREVLDSGEKVTLSSIEIGLTTGDLKSLFYPIVTKVQKKSGTAPRPPAAVLMMNSGVSGIPIGIVFRPDIKL
ncbi:hypothetical protein RMR16_023425 (plasmid) [Agrobacterium sp. rho-13.3]|uniref:hypothetical protein n=1 Tax=Agrobacterium sp. rho-13.3 TaxID=3072980 RepID=UPI002A14AF20|nr:hypothetical protein [Agrobacterium sp. rho-13.3]MDX8310321.1 hypothetical protein [Agrobacterium sp. rho-13.3]